MRYIFILVSLAFTRVGYTGDIEKLREAMSSHGYTKTIETDDRGGVSNSAIHSLLDFLAPDVDRRNFVGELAALDPGLQLPFLLKLASVPRHHAPKLVKMAVNASSGGPRLDVYVRDAPQSFGAKIQQFVASFNPPIEVQNFLTKPVDSNELGKVLPAILDDILKFDGGPCLTRLGEFGDDGLVSQAILAHSRSTDLIAAVMNKSAPNSNLPADLMAGVLANGTTEQKRSALVNSTGMRSHSESIAGMILQVAGNGSEDIQLRRTAISSLRIHPDAEPKNPASVPAQLLRMMREAPPDLVSSIAITLLPYFPTEAREALVSGKRDLSFENEVKLALTILKDPQREVTAEEWLRLLTSPYETTAWDTFRAAFSALETGNASAANLMGDPQIIAQLKKIAAKRGVSMSKLNRLLQKDRPGVFARCAGALTALKNLLPPWKLPRK